MKIPLFQILRSLSHPLSKYYMIIIKQVFKSTVSHVCTHVLLFLFFPPAFLLSERFRSTVMRLIFGI